MKVTLLGFVTMVLIGILPVADSFAADSFNFTESLKDRVVCFREEGEVYCDQISSGRFKIIAKLSLSGIDITQFYEETDIEIMIGSFNFAARLEDDPKYIYGKKSAKFISSEAVEDDFGNIKKYIKYLNVSLRWNSKQLTVVINGKTPYYLDPVLASNYTGGDPVMVSDTTAASVRFGEVEVLFDVNLTGKVSLKNVYKGGVEFTLYNVRIKGKGVQ